MPDGTAKSLTAYVADFITRTRASNIPAAVTHLGKRSILAAAQAGLSARRIDPKLSIPSFRSGRRQGVSPGISRIGREFVAQAPRCGRERPSFDTDEPGVVEIVIRIRLSSDAAPVDTHCLATRPPQPNC